MIIAFIPKELRCITTRALVKGHSRNKVCELVAFYFANYSRFR